VIVIDTSALIGIVLDEPEAKRCIAAITTENIIRVSAGTIAETMIVADGRKVGDAMRALLQRLDLDVIPMTAAGANRVADAYRRWGKGNHPAGLNFGDCFAYALADELACPLLFIGNDFARTDVKQA
jgi:ribonuclease VapC